ncbi:MAG: hypothetical protein MK101_00850 [Phycisphaerales bacterium]|nr:hypothetical protein [Phycisphaerales bacterium]
MLKHLGRGTPPRQRVAVELTARRLRAVAATRLDGGALRLDATVVQPRPENLDGLEAEAQWMAQVLDDAGIPRCPCIVSVPREDVVLKRQELPGAAREDLPAMARLAASRDLPIDPEHAVIDSLPVHDEDETAEVLSAAMPEADLERVRRRMKLAGRPARAVTLRLFGAEALVPRSGSIVVVDISGSHVEVLWVDNGNPRRARSATVSVDDAEQFTDAVTLEVRRTWLAWRAEGDGPEPSAVYLSGPESLTRKLAEPVGAITGATAKIVDVPDGIDAAGNDLQEVRSLAGLLVAEQTGRAWIDLLHPRESPDRAARLRQTLLLAVLALIVVLGGIWAWGTRRAEVLQQQYERVKMARDRLDTPWWRYNRETFRIGHLDLWLATGPDVAGDLTQVLQAVGLPGEVLLDDVVMSLDMDDVEAPSGTIPDKWSLPWSQRMIIEAEAATRDQAEALRGRLADTEPWTVTTSGADATDGRRLPNDMTLRMERTSEPGEDGS